MQKVKLNKAELLERIRTNRQAHERDYETALEQYRAAVVKELEEWLEKAQAGRAVRRQTVLQEPANNLDDYDQVIDMLEMSVEEEIELTHTEFSQYVRDNWAWKDRFAHTMMANATYLDGR